MEDVEAAISEPAAKEIPNLRIDAADFSYTSFDAIAAGWVRVTLTNSGKEPHHVQFLRLNDGVTFEQFQKALALGECQALALTAQMGGVGAVAPGGSADAILDLQAGEYAILCFIPSPSDHIAHVAKVVISKISVVASSVWLLIVTAITPVLAAAGSGTGTWFSCRWYGL